MAARIVKTDFPCLVHSANCTLFMSRPQLSVFTYQQSRGSSGKCAGIITLCTRCLTLILTVILKVVIWTFTSAVLWKLGLFQPSGLKPGRACYQAHQIRETPVFSIHDFCVLCDFMHFL